MAAVWENAGAELRLTSMCACAGCAAKIRANDIEEVLKNLPMPIDARVLAGHQSADDAVVVQIAPNLALVQTVDFFPPVVDDPKRYGRIAAANSLSDVYAMGGKPFSAMNIACFPCKRLGTAILSEILQGGLEKVLEAGAVLAGGHTVDDEVPKFGLAVTGTIDPRHLVSKGGAKPGDMLVLTKPLGTGVLTTAHKVQDIAPKELETLLTSMETLNDQASAAMVKVGVRGATDITGYGLLGHALEMCRASGTDMELWAHIAPLLPGALDAYERGYFPDGSFNNLRYATPFMEVDGAAENRVAMLADAQTSGGLLIAVAPEKMEDLLVELDGRKVRARCLGKVLERRAGDKRLHVVAHG